MPTYTYLSMSPEALILSMLPPQEFGAYMAVGTAKRARGHAQYFSVKVPPEVSYFRMAEAAKRCVPHPNGEPKHSVYVSVYRVLEHLPMSAIGNLHLVTQDGRVLEVAPTSTLPAFNKRLYLYQEIAPLQPRVASSMNPREFGNFLTSGASPISVPKIFFAELRLGDLAENPEHGSIRDLPYTTVEHLRDCLVSLKNGTEKTTKTVARNPPDEFPFRTVESGFYLGDAKELRFYPLPSERDLQTRHNDWWRSASM